MPMLRKEIDEIGALKLQLQELEQEIEELRSIMNQNRRSNEKENSREMGFEVFNDKKILKQVAQAISKTFASREGVNSFAKK